MIRKLKTKFIITNMSLLMIVLLCVFGGVLFKTYHSLEKDVYRSLDAVIGQSNQNQTPPSNQMIGSPGAAPFGTSPADNIASVLVTLDDSDSIKDTNEKNASMSKENLETAVKKVLASGERHGKISSMNLYFTKKKEGSETKIAFTDTSYVREDLIDTGITALIVGSISMLAFFFISLFLSKMSVKPVEKAWNQQQQFVADASHELKTPLTVILANNNILQSHDQDPSFDSYKWICSTQEEALHMKKLVDDLLFLAKTDAGKLPTTYVPVQLSDLAFGATLQFEPVAFEKSVCLESNITPSLFVMGDYTQLKQLLHILLDNACKYTGQNGYVFLRLYQHQHFHYLSVNNSGQPIPKNDLEHLFERFYRSDKARQREGGSGLGLSIAQKIVESHGAAIFVESDMRSGTTFTVRFPILHTKKQSTMHTGKIE